jgi:hypothetical protein
MDDTTNPTHSDANVGIINSEEDLINSLMDDHEQEHTDAPDNSNDEVEIEVETDDDDEAKSKEVAQAESDDPEFEIKVDGKTVKISQSELLKDAGKYRGAETKFREAAEMRKQHETGLQEVQKERDLLRVALEKYEGILKQQIEADQPDWQDLLDNNPAEFVRRRHAFEVKQQEAASIAAANAYLNSQREAELQKQRDTFVHAETQKLLEAIPAWKEKTKRDADSAAVSKYLGDMGFDGDAQASIVDHRLILIANKARLYDEAVAKQKAGNSAAKPVSRSERPNTVSATPTNAKAAAEKAFKKNPSKDTLADLLM